MRTRTLIGMLMVLALASVAQAQTNPCGAAPGELVINPTEICAQVPEYAVMEFGQPRITELRLAVFLAGVDPANPASAPVQVIPLGRPSADVQNVIRVSRADIGTPVLGQELKATLDQVWTSATGGGVVRSPASNFFGRSNQTPPTPASAPVMSRSSP